MRLLCGDAQTMGKWFEIELVPLLNEDWAVVVSWGRMGADGQDFVFQPARQFYIGNWEGAEKVFYAKIDERLKHGYKKKLYEETKK